MDSEFKQVAGEFKDFSEKMRDPLVVGALLNKLSEERRSTNLILREIHEKLERIEARLNAFEGTEGDGQLLSEVDEKLVAFIKARGRVCAEEVKKEFNYKGRNAASSRLNALWKQGVLEKKFAGKTAFFKSKSH